MAHHISEYNQWQAGEGTPVKYAIGVDLDCTELANTGNTLNFRLTGTITITNHPNNSRNSWPASDFALITYGATNPTAYAFPAGTSYYQTALPMMATAPASALDSILIEFRGDTYRADGPNRVSLWVRGQGLVLNSANTELTQTFNINTTFSVQATGSTQQIIAYSTTGAGSSTEYGWGQLHAWSTLADFSYRPGQTWNGSNWMSHNRSGGVCNVWTGSWTEMKTVANGALSGDPPEIYNGSKFVNQSKIGAE